MIEATTKKGPTLVALAKGVGISTQTIDKYKKRGCPLDSVESVMLWRSQNIKAVSEDADPSELGIENKRAEVAERTENARTRKLKNDEMEGLLVRRDDVEREVSQAFAGLANGLRSLGMEVANICPAELKASVKKLVDDRVALKLKALANQIRESAE